MRKYFNIKDADGNILNRFVGEASANQGLVNQDWYGTTIAYVVDDEDQGLDALSLRKERDIEFSVTIDRMNPLWWDSLTDATKQEIISWRNTWLDYPTTGVKPETRPEIFSK